jgi:hypothetical protein
MLGQWQESNQQRLQNLGQKLKRKKENNMNKLLLESKVLISEGLEFHIKENIGIDHNVYRPGSSKYFDLFSEVRELNEAGLYELNTIEKYFINETDIGKWAIYEGEMVPLDFPILEGDLTLDIGILMEKRKRKSKKKLSGNIYKGKKVELNKPKRGGSKKYYVYVKNPKTGKIKKVSWGAKGMSVGIHDPARRKSFAARHKCTTTKDKTTASYWACRTGRYPHLTGGKKKYTWW